MNPKEIKETTRVRPRLRASVREWSMPWKSRREGSLRCHPEERNASPVALVRLSSFCHHPRPIQQLEPRQSRGSHCLQSKCWSEDSRSNAHPLLESAVAQRMHQRPWIGLPPPPPSHERNHLCYRQEAHRRSGLGMWSNQIDIRCCTLS